MSPAWVDFEGREVQPPASVPQAEDVATIIPPAGYNIGQLAFRDPEKFVAGQLHDHRGAWERVIAGATNEESLRQWLEGGVRVEAFFRPFRGNFRGRPYSSSQPPTAHFPNSPSCGGAATFVSQTLEDWLRAGAIRLLGKAGEIDPPHLVMPLTIEPTKPRLCHDERFLNLWIRDSPFTLETLKDVPRIIKPGDFVTSCDHKAGYQHIKLHPDSQKYFGIQWAGFYLVYTTLPFGFKASTYVYQSLSSATAGYIRSLGVSTLAYIDDSLNGLWRSPRANVESPGDLTRFQRAQQAVYIVCQILTRLGYTLSLSKSVLIPVHGLVFLGLWIDALRGAFLLPRCKREAFSALREEILQQSSVSLKTLQRLQGKCISFMLAIPAAKLYTNELAYAISKAAKCSRPIPLCGPLLEEVLHWRFIDTWESPMPWRNERHLRLSLATDSSMYKWGACILDGQQVCMEIGDHWPTGDDRPIHVKEAHALLNTLMALEEKITNRRIDIAVDSKAVIGAWEGQKSKDPALAAVLKEIFQVLFRCNALVRLTYVPSAENPADAPSRSLQGQDCMLGQHAWAMVEKAFGPHTVDLMALDTNCQLDQHGVPLRHFTPYPTPKSCGVDIFAQNLGLEKNPYCYPPLCLMGPVVALLETSGVAQATLIAPSINPLPVWGMQVNQHSMAKVRLGRKGDPGVILRPTAQGLVPDKRGLPWDLWACRLKFTSTTIPQKM